MLKHNHLYDEQTPFHRFARSLSEKGKLFTAYVALSLLCVGITFGQKVTLSGVVRSAESGETLIGATVAIPILS